MRSAFVLVSLILASCGSAPSYAASESDRCTTFGQTAAVSQTIRLEGYGLGAVLDAARQALDATDMDEDDKRLYINAVASVFKLHEKATPQAAGQAAYDRCMAVSI